MVERLGLRIESTRQTGGHYKMVLTDGASRKTAIFAVSASDVRAMKNAESQVRRMFGI